MSRLFDVSGRQVLVTGGSRGIGEMITRGFVEAGATVYISSRTAEACQALVDELGEQVVALPADLSTVEGVQAPGRGGGRAHRPPRRAGAQRWHDLGRRPRGVSRTRRGTRSCP